MGLNINGKPVSPEEIENIKSGDIAERHYTVFSGVKELCENFVTLERAREIMNSCEEPDCVIVDVITGEEIYE